MNDAGNRTSANTSATIMITVLVMVLAEMLFKKLRTAIDSLICKFADKVQFHRKRNRHVVQPASHHYDAFAALGQIELKQSAVYAHEQFVRLKNPLLKLIRLDSP